MAADQQAGQQEVAKAASCGVVGGLPPAQLGLDVHPPRWSMIAGLPGYATIHSASGLLMTSFFIFASPPGPAVESRNSPPEPRFQCRSPR